MFDACRSLPRTYPSTLHACGCSTDVLAANMRLTSAVMQNTMHESCCAHHLCFKQLPLAPLLATVRVMFHDSASAVGKLRTLYQLSCNSCTNVYLISVEKCYTTPGCNSTSPLTRVRPRTGVQVQSYRPTRYCFRRIVKQPQQSGFIPL